MDRKMYFTLYSDKIPVEGKDRSAICDLERKRYTYIPNALYEILTRFSDRSVQELKKLYQEPERIIEYFEFLQNEELGFYTQEPERFPRIDLEWQRPESIIVAELQVDDSLEDHHLKALDELDQAGCKHVEIAAKRGLPYEEIDSLFTLFSGAGFRTIDLLLGYETSTPLDRFLKLKDELPEFNILVFHSAPQEYRNTDKRTFWSQRSLADLKKREDPPFQNLILNREFFLESLYFNPYYNRKVSIDEEGNVKNAIEHQRSFGRIGERPLGNIVNGEEFRELWYASNDKVEDVKDWELRYCWLNTHPLEKLENGNYKILWP